MAMNIYKRKAIWERFQNDELHGPTAPDLLFGLHVGAIAGAIARVFTLQPGENPRTEAPKDL